MKRIFLKMVLALLSACFTLGAIDLVVYLFPRDFLPSPLQNLVLLMEKDTHYVKDPAIGNMIKPGTDYVFRGDEFTFRIQTRLNFPTAGFRGGTLGGPAWGAAFGDSFTWGAGVDHEATWVARLARLTNREIVNFGTPGQGPHQYTRIFQKYGVSLRPKFVFYALHTNDLRDVIRFERPRAERGAKMTPKRFMKRYSATYNVVSNALRPLKSNWADDTRSVIGVSLRDRRLRDPYALGDHRFARAWEAAAAQIENAIEESKRINATFVLLYFPSKEEVYWELVKERVKDPDDFKERIERLGKAIRDFCESRHLLCLDLTPTLKPRGLRGEKFYFPVDVHWNELGHNVGAQEIYKFLRKKKLI